MQKQHIRTLYLFSLGGVVLGAALMLGSLYGGTYSPSPHLHVSPGNPPLFVVGAVILGGASIALFVAYVLSLIKMAQNQQWTWFVLSLIFNFFGFFWSIFPGIIWSFVPDAQPAPLTDATPGNPPHE